MKIKKILQYQTEVTFLPLIISVKFWKAAQVCWHVDIAKQKSQFHKFSMTEVQTVIQNTDCSNKEKNLRSQTTPEL